jgi:two-component system, NarL family, response regulator NreC
MKILLVDDHPLVRHAVRRVVQQAIPQGHIVEAPDGADALRLAATLLPRLIILDMNLPGMNGLDLIHHLRARSNRSVLLVFAAEVDPWTVREALQAGASGYLVKTNAATCLQKALRAVLGGAVFLCADSAAALEQAQGLPPAEVQPPGLAVLTRREQEILKNLSQGRTTKAIALQLELSPKTVETHRAHIMHKLRLDNLAALTRYAIQRGLTPI